LDNQTIVDLGLQLVDSCWNTYASTRCVKCSTFSSAEPFLNHNKSTSIGPEQFAFISVDGGYTGSNNPDPSTSQLAFNAQHGFYITSPYYILRPEVLESNFYAWRITGDAKYLDRAAAAVATFEKYLKVQETTGYSGISDVDNTNPKRVDDTESFWYAEVLKYL
jgi:mannosyl-oligosaccharide alpha-1,2-mannosidase